MAVSTSASHPLATLSNMKLNCALLRVTQGSATGGVQEGRAGGVLTPPCRKRMDGWEYWPVLNVMPAQENLLGIRGLPKQQLSVHTCASDQHHTREENSEPKRPAARRQSSCLWHGVCVRLQRQKRQKSSTAGIKTAEVKRAHRTRAEHTSSTAWLLSTTCGQRCLLVWSSRLVALGSEGRRILRLVPHQRSTAAAAGRSEDTGQGSGAMVGGQDCCPSLFNWRSSVQSWLASLHSTGTGRERAIRQAGWASGHPIFPPAWHHRTNRCTASPAAAAPHTKTKPNLRQCAHAGNVASCFSSRAWTSMAVRLAIRPKISSWVVLGSSSQVPGSSTCGQV